MSFNGNEGEFINPEQGGQQTAAYRNKKAEAVKARFLGKKKLEELLAQDGCMGLRMYFALDANGAMDLVVVGADANENDILGKVLDMTIPCPTRCSSANVLNS